MNSSTKLDSAVFQLTPTRTRFDLVIIANGKKEKIASGLLDPFLSHLKVAQDQITKGGYSIVLVPDRGSDAIWFTKGTAERFVRFVSTPEILERVYTLESEILQIEEAIAIQGNNSIGISTVEENQIKQVESIEGTFERTSRKTRKDNNEEKALVLYKSDAQPPEANGSSKSEGNSKVQLLKVLETRKSVLQKEQGMAFARAVAAGFDIDCMPALMSFAECFEALRLMDACRRFMALWKTKHESGQWLEIAAAKVMPNRTDFSATHASGIILTNTTTTSHTELESGSNGKTNSDVFSVDQQPTAGLQDNFQGQFPHCGFPPWPVHFPPGALPSFQSYPVQGIPYYQSYPGNNSFMQPVCPPMEDHRPSAGQNMGQRRHSMDNRHSNTESEALDVDMEMEGSQTGERHKKASRSGRQKAGMMVIRNINYITKTERTSGSGSYSDSASEIDEDIQESVKTSKRRGSSKESLKKLNSSNKDEADCGKNAEGGHWQAFQNLLLRDVDEDRHAIGQDEFELGKVDHGRRKKQAAVNDPLDFSERDMHEVQGGNIDMHSISRVLTRMPKSTDDDLLLSRRAGQSGNGRSVDDVHSLETAGRRNGCRRAANDDFIIRKQESESGNEKSFSGMVAVNGQGYSNNNLERRLFHGVSDDSYIVESRSVRVSGAGNSERNAMDMNSEFPKVHKKGEKFSYQPNELSLMPERGVEKGSVGYDPALDYEMQAQAKGGASKDKNKVVLAQTKPGSKTLNKEQRSSVGPIRRGKMNKLSPLDDARARAERLRNYKADLQKMRKEKEEEERKRLEALKMERQKRIAARSSAVTTKSPVPSQVTNKQLPTKLSRSSHKGSKFSDSAPRSSSPFQRFPIRTASVGSNGSSKASKISRLNTENHSATNKLSWSAPPSLPESKQEKGGDGRTETKSSVARIRRLSEPKMNTIHQTSLARIRRLSEPKMSTIHQSPSVKARSSGTRTISKTKATNETESRKISAIVNHDKSKTATLPELKIRTSNASDSVQNRSSRKEKTQKLNGNKSSMNSSSTLLRNNEIQTSPNDDGDDNPIIEKTVVMLECEKPCAPDINNHKSEKKPGKPKRQYDNDKMMDKTKTVLSYVAVHAPISPLNVDIVDIETSEDQSRLQSISTEVKINNSEKEPSKSSGICIAEETYRAPHARVSSLEDQSTQNSEHGKAPPTSLETASIGMETFRVRVSDSRNSTLEKIPEVNEKPQAKETSKGLGRLLKFGRKNHSSPTSGRNMESDNGTIDSSEANDIGTNVSLNQVHTLKNLILRDETPSTSATPQKSSRSFSLLSPFRSKSSEKKIMMA